MGIVAGFLVGVFAVLSLLAEGAAGQAGDAAKTTCKNAQTQREMNECLAAAYRDADRDLNLLYASLVKKLPPGDATRLRAAERAWISYRDANCVAETGLYQGGSIQPSIRSGCLERVTRARVSELHSVYDTGTR